MKQFPAVVSAIAALSVLVSACSPGASASIAQSNLRRISDPAVPSSDMSALVQGDNAFALDLYAAVRAADGNLAFSPFSISEALAMTYAGARGTTESQMAQALHYTLPQDRLHPAFNQLDQDLSTEGKATADVKTPLQLNIANAVWAEKTFSFLQSYLDAIARNYGAGIQLADFINQREAVRQQINDWVAKQTNDKIKDLIPAGALDAYTRMVLVNALYFKADWQSPFDPANTSDGPFHLLDGSQVQAKMMSDEFGGVPYAAGDGYQAIELPYAGNMAAMDLIVPDADSFQKFENDLTQAKLEEILETMQPTGMQLSMPKFTFHSSFDLGEKLAALGMSDAFSADRADFSAMTGKRDLYITKVLHQAYVAVDEQGTEAAAATSVIMGLTAARIPDQTLKIDRPFIFVIRDLGGGQILFIGRVTDPTK